MRIPDRKRERLVRSALRPGLTLIGRFDLTATELNLPRLPGLSGSIDESSTQSSSEPLTDILYRSNAMPAERTHKPRPRKDVPKTIPPSNNARNSQTSAPRKARTRTRRRARTRRRTPPLSPPPDPAVPPGPDRDIIERSNLNLLPPQGACIDRPWFMFDFIDPAPKFRVMRDGEDEDEWYVSEGDEMDCLVDVPEEGTVAKPVEVLGHQCVCVLMQNPPISDIGDLQTKKVVERL